MGLFGKKIRGTAAPAPQAPMAMPMPAPPQTAMAFDSKTFKMKLKLAKTRSEIQQGKAQNSQLKTRQAVIEELQNNKNPTAYIRMEQLLRDTSVTEAYDMINVYIDLCVLRVGMIESCRDFSTLSSDMREAIASLAFASTRLTIPELRVAVDLLRSHFGPQVIDPLSACSGPDAALVNSLMARKLDGTAPDGYEILEGLTEIARREDLAWYPPAEPEDLRKSYGTARPQPAFGADTYPSGNFFATNVPGASAPCGDLPMYTPDILPTAPSGEFPSEPHYPGPRNDYYP